MKNDIYMDSWWIVKGLTLEVPSTMLRIYLFPVFILGSGHTMSLTYCKKVLLLMELDLMEGLIIT